LMVVLVLLALDAKVVVVVRQVPQQVALEELAGLLVVAVVVVERFLEQSAVAAWVVQAALDTQ